LVCQVEDSGHITDPLIGRRHPDLDGGGSQGMWIVHQLCDLVEIRTGPAGTQIRVHTQLRFAAPALMVGLTIAAHAGVNQTHTNPPLAGISFNAID
jgi:hypothetical protein